MKKQYINRIANILNNQTLNIIMILFMMMLGGSVNAWGQEEEEKLLYSTDFTNWKSIDRKKATNEVVTLKTDFSNESFTFTLNGVGIYPSSSDKGKRKGYMETAKSTEINGSTPIAVTSTLTNITKITLHQSVTGNGNRGIKVAVKGDGDANWVYIHNEKIGIPNGEDLTLLVNRKNCQIKIESFDPGNYARVTDLAIYGMVKPAAKVNVTYYNTDGSLIGSETVEGNSALKYKYGASDVTVGSGEVFRGWFNGTDNLATKVTEGTKLISDISLYAKATPKEEATFGSEYTYDMTRNYWYAEDHDLIDITNGAYHDNQHGWAMDKGGTIKLQVASQAKIEFALCTKNHDDEIVVTDAYGNKLGTIASKVDTDGEVHSFSYDGSPTTLTFSFSSTTYIHAIKQYNYKPVYISFKFPNKEIDGTCPATIKAESDGKATLPTNGLFYRDGWTFQGWTDGTNVYQPGENIFYEDVTLSPKMEENQLDLTVTPEPVTLVWPFDHTKAPAINMNDKAESMGYTQVGTLDGRPYDVRLWMDTQTGGGKITNQDANVNSYPGEGGQFNNGTQFTLRAIYGMTITIHASDKTTTGIETTFDEATKTNKFTVKDKVGDYTVPAEDIKVIDKKTLQFTYKGDATELILKVEQACNDTSNRYGFFKDITATYPVLPYVVAINAIDNPDATNFPNEIADNAGMSTIMTSEPNKHPNMGSRYRIGDKVSIVAMPDYGYTVKGFRIKGSTDWLKTFDNTDESESPNKSCDYTINSEGITTIEAVFERKTMHKVTIKASDANLATVSLSPVYENFYNEVREAGTNGNKGKLLYIESWFTEGTEVTATAEASAGYVVDYWSEADDTHLTDANAYTYTTTAEDKTFVVHITKGESGTVIFDISNAHVNGKTVAYKNAESIQPDPLSNVSYFVVPTNYTFFKNVDDDGNATDVGYTLRYWQDAKGNRYELGSTYSFTKKETLTLTPVFEKNPATQLNRTNDPIIRYDFGRNVHEYDDPTSGLTKKECAQAVNIGNNQKPFWTTDVYVEVLENGQFIRQTRDVAMWCDTGDKGYIRNTDLDNWCAFGPGTTFWFASAAGTKISMLTYSKITTTTIDGVVPTLDEERTAEERRKQGSEHIYVYSYTTQNPDARPAIVIGDDYSYYQWFEMATPAANMVNLHTNVDNEEHGKIDKMESTSSFKGTELEDGGHAFRMGDRVRVTFERYFAYQFDKLVDPTKMDDNGNPFTVLKMNDDGTVDMIDYNEVVHKISKNADGTWGTKEGDNKTMFTLKTIEPTKEELADGKRTTYELEFDITNHRTLQVLFKEKATHYITYGPGDFAEGTAPVAQWVEAGDPFTIPQNTTLYYEGNTLDHWVALNDDGTTGDEYKIGVEYAAPAKDLRLNPVFEPNKFNILDLSQESTVTWHFTKKDGAPNINYEKTAGILVAQLYDGDKKIDLKLDLDGRNGKFNNESNINRIQINGGSIITFPSTDQCVVKLTANGGVPEQVTIGGKKNGNTDFTFDSKNKSIEVKCDGGDATKEANFTTNDAVYAIDFMVTYKPQDLTTKATIESLTCDGVTLDAATIKSQMSAKGYVSFTVSPWKTTNEVIPDVTGTAKNGGTVTVTKGTVLTPEAVATVHTSGGVTVETYPIKFEFNTPNDYPKFEKMVVNGTTYTNTSNEIYDVPRSGIIEVDFNRTMKETNVVIDNPRVEATAAAGKTLTFKYWDLPAGGTIPLVIKPNEGAFAGLMTDIYGKVCQQTLTLILHVVSDTEYYHHHKFDFIVGENGTMDEAIEAANNNTKKDGHRYFIFVPDGEYKLTGNDPLTSYTPTSDGNWPTDGNGQQHPEIANQLPYNNGRTQISKSNVSLIGQSKEGVVIWNSPFVEGISYTSTLHIGKQAKDFYAQDLSLENRFNYWGSGSAGRGVAFWDQGNRSIMKNVALISYQDTYYSNNANDDYRGYFENCDLYGVVDFLCGDGDIWLEKCNLLLRDRTGNNIAAPSQGTNHQWGYVFNNCTIKPESDNPQQLKGNDWTLARPWNGSPACTYLNTKMATQPRPAGWGRMNTGEVLRLHEYRTMDENGILLSLGTRTLASCMPAAGSDDCVLSAASAAKYTIRNAMGGTDGFEPNELCKQIDAASSITSKGADDENDPDDRVTDTENHVIWNDNLELNDDDLQWDADNRALCYFLFKLNDNGKWIYQTNTIEASVNLTPYGSGYYCVRAANQRGGLGAATKSILFTVTDPYELNLKQLGDLTDEEGNPCGWSTICLPFNAKVPSELKVYAATAHNKTTADDKVNDFTLTLTPVNVIDSEKGYVVYGPAGKHYFSLTSRSCDKETILTGNATESAITTVNKSGYVLSNKTWGLGFYKYSGSTYAPYKAWLPQEMVTDDVQQALAAGARAIRLTVEDNTTKLNLPRAEEQDGTEALYNLSGQKVNSAKESGVYISRKKGKFIKK